MGKEHEVVILDIKVTQVMKRLKELGAKHEGVHKFKRMEFLLGGDIKKAHSWVRVRTNGKENTITMKEMSGKGGFSSMKEYEVGTSDFRETLRIISRLANSDLLYWENKRDAYFLGEAYVSIDRWPSIPPFLEIEAPSMNEVKRIYALLGVEGKLVGNISIHEVYNKYGLDFKKVVGKNTKALEKLLK